MWLTLYRTIPSSNYHEDEKPFENIVGKGENAGNQHFLLFQQCFQKGFFVGGVKSHIFVVQG